MFLASHGLIGVNNKNIILCLNWVHIEIQIK